MELTTAIWCARAEGHVNDGELLYEPVPSTFPADGSIKRDIAHLCRDVTPPATGPGKKEGSEQPELSQDQDQAEPAPPPLLPDLPQPNPPQNNLYDAGSSSWPLLPDANGGHDLDLNAMARTASGISGDGWGVHTNAEFGILSCVLYQVSTDKQ